MLHRTELQLILLIAGSAILAVIAWLVLREPEDRRPVEGLAATWTLDPHWERSLPAADPPAGSSGELAIYMDSSLPIGGFLPPDGHSPQSALEALIHLAPHHLAVADKGPRSSLRWHRIASQPARLEGKPPIGRRFFTGGESRLDLAVAEIERDFAAGRLEAALVITDLITTGEIVGAQGTAQALRDWANSDGVLSGALDFGLLAIKAPYWGIRTATCRAPGAKTACFFSEQKQEWLPLPAGTALPLYVLVFTRGRAPARQILDGLVGELGQRSFVVQSELLTASTAPSEPRKIDCSVHSAADPERQQFALFGNPGNRLSCDRDEVVQLRCPLPEQLGPITAVSEASGETLTFSMKEERLIQLELDCSQRRDREFALDLRIEAKTASKGDGQWASWSSVTDDRPEDLGKTLRLQEFVEKIRVRPESFQARVTLVPAGAAP